MLAKTASGGIGVARPLIDFLPVSRVKVIVELLLYFPKPPTVTLLEPSGTIFPTTVALLRELADPA